MSESQRNEARDPVTDPARLAELAASADQSVRRGVALNASTPAEVLTQLADDSESSVRKYVGGNPSTPVEALTRLAGDPDSRWGVARNPATPMDLILLLADDPDDSVRAGVAESPSTPSEVLTRLADDSEADVRRGVALNAAAPVELITVLADDSELPVRAGVAWNPSTPVEVLTRLADDPDEWVRWGVAENPSTPVEVLTRLADDSGKRVRTGVAGNPSTPEEVLASIQVTETRLKQAQDQSTDPSRLTELADSQDPSLQILVAGNPSAPGAVLAQLADFQESGLRLSVAGNPSAPLETLTRLAGDSNGDVRRRALLNPACPNEVREESGLVFMFAVQRADFFTGRTNMLVTNREFTTDLASEWVEVLYDSGGAEAFEVTTAAEVFGGDDVVERASNDIEHLVWCGSGAPDWWSDWSLLEDFLGSYAVAALARGDEALFEDNEFKAAERVAFAGHEATVTAWRQIRVDLATVFATGERSAWGSDETVPSRMSLSQELSEVADRWLREDSWRELSVTAHRAVLSALARHPNTPTAVLQELAVSEQESVRWLVTRNPSATDEIRAAAVLAGVDDDKFTEELPDEDWMDVALDGVHVGVHASAWTREEFTERFPEVFNDPEDDWVTSDGQVTIDSRISSLPDEMHDYLYECEELERGYDSTRGSVTMFENY